MADKSPGQAEFEALPDWAQQMIRGLAGAIGYGAGDPGDLVAGCARDTRERIVAFHILLDKSNIYEFHKGFAGMQELAKALSAPWPQPPPPERAKRVFNLVELAASVEGEDDCAFDQPCAFGHRVECHAVYCHNDAWPDSPRKCHRNRDDYRHEDCPGFVANPDWPGDPA